MKQVSVCTPKTQKIAVIAPDGIKAVVITEDLYKQSLVALACIREKIGRIQHVKKVAYSPKGQLITLWTFVDDHNPNILRSIYKAEEEIMNAFRDLKFDFTVIFDSTAEAPSNFITETCLP